MYGIYANIYHILIYPLYVSIYTSTMDPVGWFLEFLGPNAQRTPGHWRPAAHVTAQRTHRRFSVPRARARRDLSAKAAAVKKFGKTQRFGGLGWLIPTSKCLIKGAL